MIYRSLEELINSILFTVKCKDIFRIHHLKKERSLLLFSRLKVIE